MHIEARLRWIVQEDYADEDFSAILDAIAPLTALADAIEAARKVVIDNPERFPELEHRLNALDAFA